MKNTYLFLTILGFILPNIFVAKVTVETGNFLLYADWQTTFQQMFANDISTAFMMDLFFLVFLFLIWSWREGKKHQMNNVWWSWLFTFAFGLAGGLPFFLYLREKKRME